MFVVLKMTFFGFDVYVMNGNQVRSNQIVIKTLNGLFLPKSKNFVAEGTFSVAEGTRYQQSSQNLHEAHENFYSAEICGLPR